MNLLSGNLLSGNSFSGNLFSKTIFNDEEAKGWLPWGVLAPIMALVLTIAILMTIGLFLLEPLGLINNQLEPDGAYGFFAFLTVSFGAVGLAFTGWIKLVERRSLASVGFSAPGGMKTFWQGHGAGIAMMAITVTLIGVFGGYSVGAIAPALASPEILFQITLLLVGFALQSSVEEFIFRGWLLSVLTRKFNLLTAILVSSALFSFMHFSPDNPWYDNVNTLVFALFACAWVIKTGNIWGVMGWHAGWNWFTAIGFEVPITGLDTGTDALVVQLSPTGPGWLTGGDMGPEGSIVCTLVLLMGTLYWLTRSTKAGSAG